MAAPVIIQLITGGNNSSRKRHSKKAAQYILKFWKNRTKYDSTEWSARHGRRAKISSCIAPNVSGACEVALTKGTLLLQLSFSSKKFLPRTKAAILYAPCLAQCTTTRPLTGRDTDGEGGPGPWFLQPLNHFYNLKILIQESWYRFSAFKSKMILLQRVFVSL